MKEVKVTGKNVEVELFPSCYISFCSLTCDWLLLSQRHFLVHWMSAPLQWSFSLFFHLLGLLWWCHRAEVQPRPVPTGEFILSSCTATIITPSVTWALPSKANTHSSWNEVAFPVPYVSWDTKGGSIAERTFNYSCHNFTPTFINNFSWIFISINIWWLLFKARDFCRHLSFNYFLPASPACPYTLDFINFSTS